MQPTSKFVSVYFSCLVVVLLLYFSSAANSQAGSQALLSDKMSGPLNVFKQPLALFSKAPMTGFYRDGYCRTGAADMGNHAVAGIVSEEFLEFSAKQGNDLRVAGLTGGCKWCLCTSRWFEAYSAWKDGRIGKEAVPKVDLEATEDSVLRKVDLDILQQFKAETESNDVH